MSSIQITYCGLDQFTEKQGIHLVNPLDWQIIGALNQAKAKGFEVVWVHQGPVEPEDEIPF